MKCKLYDSEYTLEFKKGNYLNNGNLAVVIMAMETGEEYYEPFGNLTVNLGVKLDDNVAFVDSNNCPSIVIQKLLEKGWIIPTGICQQSGFCVYQAYEFTEEFLESMETIL